MKKTMLAVFLLGVVQSANAGLIEKDWNSSGDGLITLDTDTNFEWLDLSQTLGMNFNTVNSRLGAGGKFEGFRYATGTEYETLWRGTSYDHINWYSSTYNNDPDETGRALEIGTLIGFTYDRTITQNCDISTSRCYRENLAILADVAAANRHYVTHMDFIHSTKYNSYVGGRTHWTTVADDIDMNNYNNRYWKERLGSWLVRDAVSVPEPGSLALLGLGLAGLGFSRRKKA